MTRVLDRHLEAHGDADAARAGVTPDPRAVETAIDVGVVLFRCGEKGSPPPAAGHDRSGPPATIEQARTYDRAYRTLHVSLSRLLQDAAASESSRTPRENIDRLRDAGLGLAGIDCFDLERLIRADHASRTGRPTRTTAALRDPLRHRVGG